MKVAAALSARLPRSLLSGPARMLTGDGAALLMAGLTTRLTSPSMVVRTGLLPLP
jgi:hypothetical protein